MSSAPWFRSPVKAGLQFALAEMPSRRLVDRRVVLSYHSVAPFGTRASTAVDVFRSHLAWLSRRCRVVPLDELLEPPTARGSDRPTVAITFDDGYADNHTHALPALSDLALPATFFVTTGLIEGDAATVDRLRRVWGPEMRDVRGLTWRQIDEMRSEGMTFGAHTRTHPNLRDLRDDVVRDEIASSRDALEDRLGEPVRLFAYPFGDARFHLSQATMAVAADLGLAAAFTVEYRGVSRHEDPMRVPRFPVSNDPPNILRAKVDGRLDLIGTWRERAPAWVTTRVSSGRARAAASR